MSQAIKELAVRLALIFISCVVHNAAVLAQSCPPGSSWCSGTYVYDGMGNIRAIGTDTYIYDTAGRLVSGTADVQRTGVLSRQDYSYDAFGNRTGASRIAGSVDCPGGCELSPVIDPATNHITSNGAQYDAAGNLIFIQGPNNATYTYDAVGNLVHAVAGTDDRQFIYTADDERIATRNGQNWTWTVRDLDNKVVREFTSLEPNGQPGLPTLNRQWAKDYIWRDGLLLATVTPTTPGANTTVTRHYHLDHLGTPRMVTGDNGVQLAVHAYYPFGAELNLTPTEQPAELMKFTGHERDLLANDAHTLDYMHARYDSAIMGRFLSVDPSLEVEKALKQPQRWNRYAYVTNNPMRYVDPDGRDMGFSDYASAVWEATKQTVDDAAFEVAKPFLIWGRGIQTDNPMMVAKGTGMLVVDGALGALGEVGVGRITMGFTSRANLLAHFEKHGAEFGFKLAEQYGAAASRFAATAGKEGVQAVTTKTGEKMVYNAATKEFAVVNKSGEVVTYFKANAKYWANQVRKTLDELRAVAK